MSRDAWERIDGFDPEDSPPTPECERCNDIGRYPVLIREIAGPVFTEWKFVDCPCQTKT